MTRRRSARRQARCEPNRDREIPATRAPERWEFARADRARRYSSAFTFFSIAAGEPASPQGLQNLRAMTGDLDTTIGALKVSEPQTLSVLRDAVCRPRRVFVRETA